MKVIITLFTIITFLAHAQSIRKDYKEMSILEREEYVRVMNQLYSEAVISNFVTSHRMEPAGFAQHDIDDFLPWHRIFLYYMDKEIKQKNKYLNINYVNWYQVGGVDGIETLFSGNNVQGLVGFPLNTAWDNQIQDRRFQTLGSRNLWTSQRFFNPTKPTVISNIFNTFRRDLEGRPHGTFHAWVGGNGGTMGDIESSPLDPVFYFHHAMVDKVWEDWNKTTWNGTDFGLIRPNLGSIIGKPTYDGKALFDARVSKLWYAENKKVVLDNYTASNQTLGVTTGNEFYFYTDTIKVAGTATRPFVVPNNTNVKIESMTEIALLPGFSAEEGSTFGAEIISTFPAGAGFEARKENIDTPSFEIQKPKPVANFKIIPNPNNGNFKVQPLGIEVYKIEVFDLNGKRIAVVENDLEIKLNQIQGVFLVVVTDMEGILHSKTMVIE